MQSPYLGGIFWITLVITPMLIEEEEPKSAEINPDALEDVFDGDILVEEESITILNMDDEDVDALDMAFVDDDHQW